MLWLVYSGQYILGLVHIKLLVVFQIIVIAHFSKKFVSMSSISFINR